MNFLLKLLATIALVALAICCFLTHQLIDDYLNATPSSVITKVTLGGVGPSSNYLDGKLIYQPYTYPSNLPDADIYNSFELLDQDFKVKKVSYLKISESGTYSDDMLLEIIAMDFAGNPVRTISVAPVGHKNAALGSWIDIPVVTSGSTEVFAGEQLIAHVWRTGPAGGSYTSTMHLSADIALQ